MMEDIMALAGILIVFIIILTMVAVLWNEATNCIEKSCKCIDGINTSDINKMFNYIIAMIIVVFALSLVILIAESKKYM